MCALALTALAGVLSHANAQEAKVSMQVVNLAEGALVSVHLDRRLIYEGAPTKETLGVHGAMSVVVGSFDLRDGRRHVLVAEAPATGTKTQFEWSPQRDSSPWIVIRYHPGRPSSGDPPSFTIVLQEAAYKLK